MKPPGPIPPDLDSPREAWAEYYEECIVRGVDQIVTPLGVVNRRKNQGPSTAEVVAVAFSQLIVILSVMGLMGWFGWLIFSLFKLP